MRLVTEVIEFSAERAPRFNPISISGSHIREAGSTAVQELAFTARKIWAYTMRDRFHTQTAGCSVTWQPPYSNGGQISPVKVRGPVKQWGLAESA